MLIRRFSLSIVLLLLLSLSCGDDGPTKPTPDDTFELRVTVVDSAGSPVEGLQVSAWNVIHKTEVRYYPSSPHPTQNAATSVLPGDVDCDGVTNTFEDEMLIWGYIFLGDSIIQQRGLTDCFLRNGDIVKESPGITTADWLQVHLSAIGWPAKKRHKVYELSYTYDRAHGRLELDDSLLHNHGVRLSVLRIITSTPPNSVSSKSNYDCLWVDYWYGNGWTTSIVTALSDFSVTCREYMEYASFEISGDILIIEGCTDECDPVVLKRRAREEHAIVLAPQPCDSLLTILLEPFPFPHSIVIRDLNGEALDSIGIALSDSQFSGEVLLPVGHLNSGVYVCELITEETPELTGKGQTMLAVWSDDPERNSPAITNSSGVVSFADELQFPGLLLNDFVYGSIQDSFYRPIGYEQVEYLDSIHVVVRDTLHDVMIDGTYPLVTGKNNVQVIWP